MHTVKTLCRWAVASAQLMHWLVKACGNCRIRAMKKRGESCIFCTQLYRQMWKMETPVCKCSCRYPTLEIACPAWVSLATIIKSDFGWGSRQRHLLCNSASTWGLAQILFPRPWRWHVHGVPSLASAQALLTKHPGHEFSSGSGVQDECPSHTSLIWIWKCNPHLLEPVIISMRFI